MCENSLPKGSLESKIATGRAKIELAMRSTRSTKPRRKIILGTIERCEKLREKLYQHRASQNIWSTSFCSRTAEYNTWEQGQEVDREVREPPAQGILPSVVEETLNLRRNQQSSSRTTTTSPQPLAMLSRKEQSRGRMCQTRTFQAKQMLRKVRQKKRRRNVQNFVVTDRVERKRRNAMWQNCLGEAHLRRDKRWEMSKFEALDSHARRRRISATTQSTTRLCWSNKRVQTIARRAPGKDPARLQNHPSQSTSKTNEGVERHDFAVEPQTGWRFCQQQRRNLPTVLSSSSNLDRTYWKTSSWNSRHSSWPGDLWKKFSELGPVSVAWRKNSSQPAAGVNSTPTSTSRTEMHSMITFHHANTRGSRAAKLRIAHLCAILKQLSSTCHVSLLAALANHKHKFSLTYLISLPTISPTHTRPSVHDPYLPCEVPRQRSGSTQIPSLTRFEPTLIETEAIEPEDIEPNKVELDKNLGTDPHQIQERKWEATSKILSPKIWMNLENMMPRCPTSSHRWIIVSVSYINKLVLKDWNCRTLNTDILYDREAPAQKPW